MVKSTYIDRNGVRRGAWTKEEDHKLRAYVERFGHSNWRLLPKFAGLDRCGKSCRLRWMNYLKPGLERGGYTQQERDLIAKLHHLHGNKWSVMAAELPGRTDQGIKNYWHAHHKNRKNTTSKSFAGEEGEISELSNVDTTAAPKLGSRKHIRTIASTSQVVVLESSEFNSTAVPTVVELGSDDSTEQSCSNGSSITSMATHDGDNLSDLLVSEFHDNFWTQPFMVETDSYQGYHDYDFSVFDEGGVFYPVYPTL